MKTKQLFKRILSWSLAGAAALSLTVFAHAETATATEAPVAANMVGKTIKLDGVMDPAEGWTKTQTLVADSQSGDPVYAWFGTDGTYLYGFVKGNSSSFKMFDVQFDFLNTDDQLSSEDDYRKELVKDMGYAGVKSAKIRLQVHETSKPAYGTYYFLGSGRPTNIDTYVTFSNCAVNKGEMLNFEFKLPLSSDMKAKLQTSSYTIGADIAGLKEWDYTQWSAGLVENKQMLVTKCRDVVLPCTASAVGELIGYQIAAMTEGYSVRFLSTLEGTDYTEYAEVGFRFELNGKTVEKSCRSVYHTVLANYGAEQVRAKTYGATYLYACTVEGLSATGTYTFTVTPWTLKAGETEKTYGTPCTVTIQNGAAVTE